MVAGRRLDELEIRRKHTWHVSVTLETVLVDSTKNVFHLVLVVDGFRKNIFVGGVPWQTMNEHELVLVMQFGKLAQVIPAAIYGGRGPRVQTISSPINGSQGDRIEPFGIKKSSLIVVAHDGQR